MTGGTVLVAVLTAMFALFLLAAVTRGVFAVLIRRVVRRPFDEWSDRDKSVVSVDHSVRKAEHLAGLALVPVAGIGLAILLVWLLGVAADNSDERWRQLQFGGVIVVVSILATVWLFRHRGPVWWERQQDPSTADNGVSSVSPRSVVAYGVATVVGGFSWGLSLPPSPRPGGAVLLWLFPAIAMIVGSTIVARGVRMTRRQPSAGDEEAAAPADTVERQPLTDDDREE